jgi:predicted LPLAT superfamily acyltransferase
MEHLRTHIEAGRGCVLLGAHLGSFDAMRAVARSSPVHLRPAMYRANAGALTAIMERLDPELAAQIIDIGKPGAMLQVRECLERGDLVAFLADRATDPKRLIAMPFFGDPALFPTGPFQIATMLRAPMVMFHGIRTGRRRYLLRFEPISEPSPPADPDFTAGPADQLRRSMSSYVGRLEAACRAYPFQWFNFYPFWRPLAPSRTATTGTR